MYQCMFVSLCMHACMHSCMCVCVSVCISAYVHVRMFACLHVVMHACMYVCMSAVSGKSHIDAETQRDVHSQALKVPPEVRDSKAGAAGEVAIPLLRHSDVITPSRDFGSRV